MFSSLVPEPLSVRKLATGSSPAHPANCVVSVSAPRRPLPVKNRGEEHHRAILNPAAVQIEPEIVPNTAPQVPTVYENRKITHVRVDSIVEERISDPGIVQIKQPCHAVASR